MQDFSPKPNHAGHKLRQLARFVWFWPEPVPFRRPKATPNIAFVVSAFERLSILEMAPGDVPPAKGSRQPFSHRSGNAPTQGIVPLTEAAATQLEAFAQEIQVRQTETRGLMVSCLGKVRGLALRLSLVLEYLHWAAEE